MQPKIIYREKTGKLLIKIVIFGQSFGTYDTGITIDPKTFSESQQICGDISVMAWMADTRDKLLKMFRPGMTAKSLWASFIQSQSNSGATIQDAFNYYIANMPLADNTKALYGYTMKAITKADLQDTELSKVTPGMLRQFIAGLQIGETSKFNALNHIKTIISRYIFDHSLDIELNLNGIMKRPKYTIKEKEWLTLEEVRILMYADLNKTEAMARDLFCLSCLTGMRMGDSLSFSKDWIQTINGHEFIVFNTEKTGLPCRVPIVKEAREIINRRDWPVKLVKRTYQYQVSKLGNLINRKLNTHQGRKTAGSLFLEFGFSIESTSSFLGHRDLFITSRLYSRISTNKVDSEIDRISASGVTSF